MVRIGISQFSLIISLSLYQEKGAPAGKKWMVNTGQILQLLPVWFSESAEIKLRADFDPFY